MDFYARSSFCYIQKFVEWIDERRTARLLKCRCHPTTIARSINDRFGTTEFRERNPTQIGQSEMDGACALGARARSSYSGEVGHAYQQSSHNLISVHHNIHRVDDGKQIIGHRTKIISSARKASLTAALNSTGGL